MAEEDQVANLVSFSILEAWPFPRSINSTLMSYSCLFSSLCISASDSTRKVNVYEFEQKLRKMSCGPVAHLHANVEGAINRIKNVVTQPIKTIRWIELVAMVRYFDKPRTDGLVSTVKETDFCRNEGARCWSREDEMQPKLIKQWKPNRENGTFSSLQRGDTDWGWRLIEMIFREAFKQVVNKNWVLNEKSQRSRVGNALYIQQTSVC